MAWVVSSTDLHSRNAKFLSLLMWQARMGFPWKEMLFLQTPGAKEGPGSYLSLCQTGQMHLLVEEIDHFLLGEAEWDISDINPPGLSGDGAPHHGDGSLGRVRHEGGRDLARLLHALVLHGSDVLEPGRRHIPVQRRLASLGLILTISTVARPGPGREKMIKLVMVSGETPLTSSCPLLYQPSPCLCSDFCALSSLLGPCCEIYRDFGTFSPF